MLQLGILEAGGAILYISDEGRFDTKCETAHYSVDGPWP